MGKLGDLLNKDVGSIASKVLKADVADIVKGAGRALNTDVGIIAKGAGKVLKYDLGELFTEGDPSSTTSATEAGASAGALRSTAQGALAATTPVAITEAPPQASTGAFEPVAAEPTTGGAAEPQKARLTEALVNRLLLNEPAGSDLLTLLPLQSGNYTREKGSAHGSIAADPVNVTYSGNGEAVSVTIVSCWDADEARDKLERSKAKLENSRGSVEHCWIAGIDSRGVVFLWVRSSFCYEVVSPRGVSPIARFLGEFPY